MRIRADTFTNADTTPNKALYTSIISSGPIGSYAPSFTSIITVPLSRTRTVCHWPMGILRATTFTPG